MEIQLYIRLIGVVDASYCEQCNPQPGKNIDVSQLVLVERLDKKLFQEQNRAECFD